MSEKNAQQEDKQVLIESVEKTNVKNLEQKDLPKKEINDEVK
jgi:hypothetical protein